jgi:hypothetical protein
LNYTQEERRGTVKSKIRWKDELNRRRRRRRGKRIPVLVILTARRGQCCREGNAFSYMTGL